MTIIANPLSAKFETLNEMIEHLKKSHKILPKFLLHIYSYNGRFQVAIDGNMPQNGTLVTCFLKGNELPLRTEFKTCNYPLQTFRARA